jgi:hypothetical protein
MHPNLMTLIADERALDLRSAADARRRGRSARSRSPRRFALRRARRTARVAHA